MLNVSAEWQRSVILNDNRQYLGFADIVTTKKEKISTDNSNYWEGGFSIEDSTSIEDTFTVGILVASKLTLALNNIYDDYSKYDFTDAKVTAYIGKQLDSGLEKIKIGEFTVNEQSYDGSIITLTCLDNVNKFNKSYSESTLSYPTTAYEIVRNACLDCGVPFTMAKFDNSDFVVDEKPDSQLTYGQVLAYVLQLCGSWGKCNVEGTLTIGWYDMTQFDEKNYHGGTFSTATTPYSDGDTLSGGNFTDYSSGDSASGGTFTEARKYHILYGMSDFNVSTDDVVITGVKITITSNTSEEDDYEYLAGNKGYVVSITDNPLITKDKAKSVADFVYKKIGGMRFRPLSGNFLSDPTIEAGDVAIVVDRKQNSYNSFISNRSFSIGNDTAISCDAESPARNSADQYSSDTKAIVEARKVAKTQISAYDTQMQLLTQLMAQSFGLFKTEQKQSDGSIIYIMHNKADLNSSQIQWKMTANGIAVSSDYGKTWNAGIDKDGNAIFNIMSAIGINFDWAHGGTLTLGGEDNVDGKQYVKDSNGNILITLDNRGITLANGVKISWDNISNQPSIPKNTSDLNNDSDFATTGQIPTKNSQLANDSNYTTMSDVEKKKYTTMTEVEKKNYTTMQAVLDKKYQNSDQVTQITKNTVTSAFISTLGLLVGKEIQMGENATISWNNVTNQPSIPKNTSDLNNDSDFATTGQIPTNNNQLTNGAGYQNSDQVTQITKNTVTTDFVNALNVKAGSVDAENITGTTITGKDIVGNSSISLTGGSVSDTRFKIESTNNTGTKFRLECNGGVLRLYKDNENVITLYSPFGSVGAKILSATDYVQATNNIKSPKFEESGRGYVMAGDATGHRYHCRWDGEKLGFQVDVTWVWSSSDRRLKKNISSIQDEYIDAVSEVDFVQYNLNRENYSDKPLYFGAIAQDVVEQLEKRGLTDDGLRLLSKQKQSDNDDTLYYGMDYEQFILLRLAGDEKKIRALESRVSELENKLSKVYQKLGIESEV